MADTSDKHSTARWVTAILTLMVCGLVLMVSGVLIPAHFRGVDAQVIEVSGVGTSSLVDEGLRLMSESRISQAQLFLTAAKQCNIKDVNTLERQMAEASHWQSTNQAVSELDLILQDHPWALKWNGSSAIKLLATRRARAALQAQLGGAVRSGVLEFLNTLQLTNLVYFSPARSASGQPYEAAALLSALLVQQDHLPQSLRHSMESLAYGATRKGEVQALERYYMDLVSLGNRLNWGQLIELMNHVPKVETLTSLANLSRQKSHPWQILFAAANLQGSAKDVTDYLMQHSQTGRKDLLFAVSHGQGALNRLIDSGLRIAYSPTRNEVVLYEPFNLVFTAWLRLTQYSPGWAIWLKYGLILLGAFFMGRALIDLLPIPDGIAVKRWNSPAHFALSGVLIILAIALWEPFLFQKTQTLDFPLHWKLPMVNEDVLETITNELKPMLDKLTILALVFFLLIQAIIYVICLLKLAEIRRQAVSNELKIKLLDNEENMFDAGLYAGLGGTVLSLVLLAMGVIKPSLMAAYASTLFGIIFVGLLKICHLRPLRRKLIITQESTTP
jgi:hypothetical protein